MTPLTVFSHLRWDFVFQRPQQVMTRLAAHYRISFVEEPVFDDAREPWIEVIELKPNLRVLRPHTRVPQGGFCSAQQDTLERLLAMEPACHDGIVWLYTPMAFPLVASLRPRSVVYDCMDDLSGFLNAPPELAALEQHVARRVDVALAGGRSLYELKAPQFPKMHCLPSSIDIDHFAKALDTDAEHPLQAQLPRPRLGYYGVLDERLDIGLIAELADARPDWQIVLAGPVAKISPEDLPRRANIYYLGMQPYESLPLLLAGWDVCLMPFARNDATRYISPTKLLEFMAAEKPIVSTPITDVMRPYGEACGGPVAIADTHEAFIEACGQALSADSATLVQKRIAMREIVMATSWDRTVAHMHVLVEASLEQTASKPAAAHRCEPVEASVATAEAGVDGHASAAVGNGTGTGTVTPLAKARKPVARRTIIIGAGPTGLSAAWHLGADALLIERETRVGGWCRSITDQGFTFDFAGHIMFSNDADVLEMYRLLLGDNVHWQDREAWIWSHGVHTRYPFQGALYGLPSGVLKECLLGAIEAHIAAVQSTRAGSGPTEIAPEPKNFEDFILRVWGAGVAKHFALPYNRKIWAVPLKEMETSWLAGRVPLPDLAQMIDGALEPAPKPMGPNARFGYPLRGGFQALMDAFVPQIKGDIELGAELVSIRPNERVVELRDGRRYTYEQIISTMPLPALIRACGERAPAEIRAVATGLRHVSVRCVNLGIGLGEGRERLTDKHWIYYPGDAQHDPVFHRIFVQGNASPACNAPGGFGLTCEISYSPDKPLPIDGEALIQRCIEDCIKVGMIRAEDPILCANQVDMPIAYVVYDHARAANVERIRVWAAEHGIILAGRYSEWEYYNSDHAFLAGKRAAEATKGAAFRERKQALPVDEKGAVTG